ncbi:MAG TPA: polyphosphate:AMP phosphotransferase [Polyangiaceae bacterium]|nr:polyphosphate:AMP phosphotransferase [Polyangiaceae bacterium]
MFETAELGRKLSKDEYKEQVPLLRTELLTLQRQLEKADFPVIILLGGVDGSGRGDVLNLLNEWMDARGINTVAFDAPTEEERHRPPYWRYWMALPPKGRIALMTSAWYTTPVVDRAYGRTDDSDLDASLQRIGAFEKTLVDEGALLIKLWLHISKERQRKRLKKLEKNPRTRWRVGDRDWKHAKLYDEFRRISERTLRATSTGEAPWFVIESANARYRDVTVAQQIAERLKERLQKKEKSTAPRPLDPIPDPDTILDTLDLGAKLEKTDYNARLDDLQASLNGLSQWARDKKVGVTLVFEGWDASGKGGAIRRIIQALDARDYRAIPVAAPTEEERAQHYLWRFWRHLPRLGRFTLYDRSWYGRVLVERVEGLARPDAWMRAYKEINDFEEQLVAHGIVLVKYWLHISREEQMKRFEERERTPWKQHKITEEDYRNREKANLYEAAANDMIERTSTEYAPWTLVPAEDKRFARVMVLETICERLRAAID